MPLLAPLPIPATVDTGTPITRAPGQPSTMTVIANLRSLVIRPTAIAITSTAGV